MKSFSIFKKLNREPKELSPVGMLRLIQENVPDFYKDNAHFKESKEFLEYSEWGLALESIIEMAIESGHYFSDNFWSDLAICADRMQMTEQAKFCRQQILSNEK